MARLDKSVLGFVSGKMGDVVFRRMNGKKFISLSAKKYKISQSDKAKEGRANFAALVKFAKFINSIPELKEVWSTAKIEGTNSYHRIIKYNSKLINSGKLTKANKITPDGLALRITSLLLNEANELELDISFPQDKINFPAQLYLVLVFDNDQILKQSAIIENRAPENTLNVPLNNLITKELTNFSNFLVYCTVLGKNMNEGKIFWTSTAVVLI